MRLLVHEEALVARDPDEHRARHAFQHAEIERRRDQDAVLDEEDVGGAAFGDAAGEVEEDRVVGPRLVRLLHREDVVQVVAGLQRRVEGLRRIAPGLRDRHPQPALVLLFGDGDQRPHDDHQPVLAAGEKGREAELADAARDHDPRVRLGVAGRVERPLQLAEDGLSRRQRQVDARGRLLHPHQVAFHLERAAAVGPDHLVHAVAVEEAAVEDGHHRLLGREQLSFHVAEDGHGTLVPRAGAPRNLRTKRRIRGARRARMRYNFAPSR